MGSPFSAFFASQVKPPEQPGPRFIEANLAGALFQECDLTHAHIRGANLVNADIWGAITGLTINGIEIEPLIEAELERRHPGRATLFASDPDGVRASWATIERLWNGTMARAASLPEPLLHERPVPEEWSVLESLRHLVSVAEGFVRQVRDRDLPRYREAVPHEPQREYFRANDLLDLDADPSFEEVAALRARAFGWIREIVDGIDADELDRIAPVTEHDLAGMDLPVRWCFWRLVNEEWEHHLFVERDLAALEGTV